MSMAIEIRSYLRQAIEINKKLGGTRAYEAEDKCKDKFISLRDQTLKDIHWVMASFEERQKARKIDQAAIEADIRMRIDGIKVRVDKMRQLADKELATNQTAARIKFDIVDRLSSQVNSLYDLFDSAPKPYQNKNIQTLTDETARALDSPIQAGSNRVKRKQKKDGPSEIEITEMKKMSDRDAQFQQRLGDIVVMTKEWKDKLVVAGQLIDQTDVLITDLTKQADNLNQNLLRSNKQLKGVLEKFRKPHKFCLDIILVLIFIGLIVGIVKVSQS